MRKYAGIFLVVLLLTLCFSHVGLTDIIEIEEQFNNTDDSQIKDIYIRDEIKEIISEINNLRAKYKYDDDAWGSYVYINIYEDASNHSINDIEFNNRNIISDEYFNELVEILDRSMARGLKDYVDEMKVKELKIDKPLVKKMGKAVVYSENRGRGGDNYLSIIVNFSEVEDEYYGKIFNKISDDKYVLQNLIIGEKLNLLAIGNPNIVHDRIGSNASDDIIIRYNIFFQDRDIEKVNILLQGKKGVNFKDEDIDVLINLLNNLELNSEEKDILISKYKDIFENKDKSKKISLDNYNIIIKANKGNIYSGRDRELIYFSMERK